MFTMKKYIAILLVLLMVIASLAGCASQTQAATPHVTVAAEATSSGTTATQSSTEQVEPVTMTAFIDTPSTLDGWKWGDDDISKEITKLTGVTLEVANASTTDHQELSTMLAAGKDLPDFIIVYPYGTIPQTLISQGFVAPLNKLADQYDPNFMKVLPTDEDKVLNWSDGNLYYVVDQFGDEKRMSECKEPFSPQVTFMVNDPMLQQLGTPSIKTLEEFRTVLASAKAKFGTDFTIFDGNIKNANSDQNMAQAINRLMGGTNVYSIQPDKTVRLNFQDKTYYDALKYINSLYHDGTFNPENFTVTSDQLKQLLSQKEMFAYMGHFWQVLSGYEGGFLADATYQIKDYPLKAGIDPKNVKLLNSYCSVGVLNAVFINASTKTPERAIKYLDFLLSDQGQILSREGVEGVTYTLDSDGIPNPTDLRKQYEAGPVDKLQKDLGMNNPEFSWITSTWAFSLARHLRINNEPYYKAFLDTAKPYASWERLNVLSGIVTDSDLLSIQTQVMTLWNNALPSLYLAKSDSDFDAAYQKLISDAKALGLDKLQAAYTANYVKYSGRGIK